MREGLKEKLRERNTWQRALFMLLFAVIYGVVEFVIFVVVLFQFLSVLFTGSANQRLLDFGQSLSTYVYQILVYLTYNSENRPYPFGDWPGRAPGETAGSEERTNT